MSIVALIMINLTFPKKSIKTGELHFQFDEDESIPIGNIIDYQEWILTFKQNKQNNSDIQFTNNASIGFTGTNGKKFKIFIKPTKERMTIFSRKNKFKIINEIGFFKKLLQYFRTK